MLLLKYYKYTPYTSQLDHVSKNENLSFYPKFRHFDQVEGGGSTWVLNEILALGGCIMPNISHLK